MPNGSDELENLLAAIAAQDKRAFRRLYDLVAPRLMATAMRILRDRELAEDAVQEAFVRIWRSAGRFDPARGVALAWMGVIARNAALDRVSSARDTVPIDDVEIVAPDVEPADAKLGQCIKKLPEQQGQALVLMYIYGLTHNELSERLSAPLGTVKSWVRRGAIALRECLET